MIARFLLFILLVMPWAPSFALDSTLTLQQFNHTKWTAKERGPGQVGAIAQTGDGYLWLGANYSLYRFDGIEFERYTSPDGATVATVSKLLAAPDGKLWIAQRYGGVSVISDGQLTSYPPGSGLPEGAVYGLALDHGGAIWAAAHEGLARFDGKRWESVGAQWGFPEDSSRAVFVDRAGGIWAASNERLFHLPAGANQFTDVGESMGWVTGIIQAPDDTLWISQIYPATVRPVAVPQKHFHLPSDALPLDILFDADGTLWIATQGHGLMRVVNPGAGKEAAIVDVMEHADGLSSNILGPLFEDREGLVWAGTSTGLDRFQHASTVPAGIAEGAYNVALAATPEGAVWAGSSNQPVTRLFEDQIAPAAPVLPVTAAFTDSGGNVWMGGPGGIWRSRGNELFRVAELPIEDPPEAAVRAMTLDGEGTLWVSINRLGLFTWKNGIWRQQPGVSDAPKQQMPVVAMTDKKGRSWFGYRENLLVKREGKTAQMWDAGSGLEIGHVTSLFDGSQGVWLGGSQGLALLIDNGIASIRAEDPRLLRGIHAVIEVGNGDLWIHAAVGVLQLPAIEIKQALAEPDHEVRFRSFEHIDRLPDDPLRIHPLPTAILANDGRLWFTSASGVVWIDPTKLHDDLVPPTVAVKRVTVDAKLLDSATEELVLPTQPGHTVIDYTGLHFAAPEGLRFRYRLLGFDDRWQQVGHQRRAIYTGLDPGTYRFEVEAISNQGLISAHPGTLRFVIPPVIYASPMFKMLYLVLGLGALWTIYLLRMRYLESNLRARLEERHRERERIARELHDTLLQGFQGLVLQFQAVAEKLDRTAPLRIQMERALDRADEALAEGRDRVRNLRDASVGKDLMGRLTDTAQSLMPGEADRLQITIKGTPMPLNPIVHDEIYWIAREAIINAFKHAHASQIKVSVTFRSAVFRLTVRDNGIGLCLADGVEQSPGHWGLKGMQERADWIGGSLKIANATEQGTEVRLQVPGERAYRSDVRQIPRWLRPIIFGRRNLWRYPIR